jgi:hypothetical protein
LIPTTWCTLTPDTITLTMFVLEHLGIVVFKVALPNMRLIGYEGFNITEMKKLEDFVGYAYGSVRDNNYVFGCSVVFYEYMKWFGFGMSTSVRFHKKQRYEGKCMKKHDAMMSVVVTVVVCRCDGTCCYHGYDR